MQPTTVTISTETDKGARIEDARQLGDHTRIPSRMISLPTGKTEMIPVSHEHTRIISEPPENSLPWEQFCLLHLQEHNGPHL